MASTSELSSLVPEITLKANSGNPVFHMVEIDRSSLFEDMYQKDLIITANPVAKANINLAITPLLNEIIVLNFDPEFTVELLDLSGRKLDSRDAKSDMVRFNPVSRGVYCIRNKGNISKILF
jgi:hypothetical protein